MAPYSDGWIHEQRRTVREKLPPTTAELWSDGWLGWSYPVTDEFFNRYLFWVAYDIDRCLWVTYLLAPDPAELRAPDGAPAPSAHDIHLYPDREVCLTPEIGCRSLEAAYARSVIWARGVSCYRAGAGFRFNPGQAW